MGRVVRIATRGSALALRQTEAVQRRLEETHPGLRCELVVVKTTGDVRLDKPLHMIGANDLFTRQLEQAMLAGEADLCVHSMKDLPSELPATYAIAAVLPRADVRDALVCGPRLEGVRSLADLPAGAVIGTGSLRRQAQVRAQFPQVALKGIRGNVDTRLAKARGDLYDGAILAAAGLERLGLADQITAPIPPEVIVPAVGQGAIGVEIRKTDAAMRELVSAIDDIPTHECVDAERAVLAALGGSCKVPVGIYARYQDGCARMSAVVLSEDGARVARSEQERPLPARVADLVPDTIAELMGQGAAEILADILRRQQADADGRDADARDGDGRDADAQDGDGRDADGRYSDAQDADGRRTDSQGGERA